MDLSFEPKVWPEDKLPKEAESYRQCELCTQKSRIIWGEGSPGASVFIILDNPGAREDKAGGKYICGTRQTLQRALHNSNISADDVYLTFLLKCRPLRSYNKEEARSFSKPFLLFQIENSHPKIIVCLGDVVTRTMLNNDGASVKNMRGRWHEMLGYPCLISYHPLAVRRRPSLLPIFTADMEMLAQKLYSPFG